MPNSPARLPDVIAALQFPPFRGPDVMPMSWYEDYLLANAEAFVAGGIRAIKIQDETRQTGAAGQRTIARMSVLGRMFKQAHPDVALGIIVQAHDAVAPLTIADACGADFVRLKVFVGTSVNAEGTRNALSVEAAACREELARPDIAIMADVHDRTSVPLSRVDDATAAGWAQNMGADAIVLTGSSFDDSRAKVAAVRAAGVKRPLFIGGGIDADNIATALAEADGVVVSTSLLRKGIDDDDILRWDVAAVRRMVETLGR
ncbi:BtpA/SgcQ family protein [Oceaniglobus roseus]|uniref:BtpA/SgcQ family protein n=1 Tax=Oceaniglobus roseus TaxID=1737570 RepID=UPI0015629137|nr:BtpA/SgcQ family protein [Kandeliimicrobium roseum]